MFLLNMGYIYYGCYMGSEKQVLFQTFLYMYMS